MKKIYLLGLALTMFSFAQAQITIIDDNFDSYDLGPLHGGHWDNWAQDGEDDAKDITVTDRISSSSNKSGYIGIFNAQNGQDALLLMPNVYTQGKVTAEWKMYVPSDSVAYYNVQETDSAGESWAFQCYINVYDTNDVIDGHTLEHQFVWRYSVGTTGLVYAYAPFVADKWITVKQIMDLDNEKINFYIDGTEVTYVDGGVWPGSKKSIGSFDFFSYNDTASLGLVNGYYLDDIKVTAENVNGISEIKRSSNLVSLYPNPSNDYITIFIKDEKITNIEVYNVAGQMVLNEQPLIPLAKVNIQNLAAGIYTAKIRTKTGIFSKEFVVKK